MSNDLDKRYPFGSFPTSTPCHTLFVSGLVQGGFVGLIAGLYFGTNNTIRNSISPPSFRITHYPMNSGLDNFKMIARFSLFTTFASMLYTGTFFGVQCFAERTRNKNDVWNSTIGGGFAGTVLALFYSKHPTYIVWNCLSLGALGTAFHLLRGKSQTD